MTRRAPGPCQLPLFDLGPVSVHIRRWSPLVGAWVCAWCRADLAAAAAWDRLGGCHACPGYVEPAPEWALLTGAEEPAPGHLAAKEAA